MFKTDILFTGFYGQRNTGDDAFVEVSSWGAQKYWSKSNNRFLAIEKELPDTVVKVKGYPISVKGTYSLQNSILLKNTDYLISSGGSTIHSKIQKNNVKYQAVLQKKRTGKLKNGAIGVSVGPFKTSGDENAVKEYLQNIDFLAVRDNSSFDYVKSLDLPYEPVNAFDLAALLPQIYGIKDKKIYESGAQFVVGISVCPYESVHTGLNINEEKKRNLSVENLIKYLDENENIHFKFFVINGNQKNGDTKLTIDLISKTNPKSYEIIDYSPKTRAIWENISVCDFVISTRLHAAIFACFANVPFMLNEYHRKCGDFLQNVGYHRDYRLVEPLFDAKEKGDYILNILNNPSLYFEPNNLSEMAIKAEFNFTRINL